MKLIRRILLAGTSLLAMTAHATADPISIGFALFAGPLGSVFSFSALVGFASALPTIIGIGLSIAGTFIGRGGGQGLPDPGQYKGTFENAETSEIRAVGRVRVGGLKAFGNTSDYLKYRLMCHCRGPIDAVEEHFLGGRSVTVESDGYVSSPPWAKVGGSWARVQAKIGDGTETAWGDLITAFSALWTSDHKLQGIAQSLIRFESPGFTDDKFLKLYQAGVPDYERVQRSELIYDPRQDSTNGGSGAHRADDESTWTYGSHGDNGILVAVHIMRAYPNVASADFDWADIITEANKADATVSTLTGTEKRSRVWGFWQSEAKRGDVMSEVLRSAGADVQMSEEGKIRIRLVDDTRTADITFNDDHIVEFEWRSGPEGVERPNMCRVLYYSPERNYDLAEIPLTSADSPWAFIDDEITAYGEKVEEIRLPFCPSASQAQRIARRLFELKRADSGVIVTNMAGMAAWGRPVVNIALPDLDETVVAAIASPRVDDESGTVEIPYIVWPTLDSWTPGSHESPAPPQIPEIAVDAALTAPTGGLATLVQYPSAAYEIRFLYTLPGGGTVIEAAYRTYSGGNPQAWTSMTEVASPTYAWAAAGGVGVEADFRVRQFNDDGDGSNWSDTVNVTLSISNTAPGAPTVGSASLSGFTDVTTDSYHAVQIKLWRRYKPDGGSSYGSWSELSAQNVRPGQLLTFVDGSQPDLDVNGEAVNYQLIAYTSDGTAGTPYDWEFIYTT